MQRADDAVQFDYDNGVGSRVDRFAIDLYYADGQGDCGTWVANLCDKPSIGCKDSSKCSVHLGVFMCGSVINARLSRSASFSVKAALDGARVIR